MSRSDKLNAILAKCRANLALAAKRTQGQRGKWFYWKQSDNDLIATGEQNGKLICGLAGITSRPKDFAYIAACAGSAEAGWRSTIAAIEGVRFLSENGVSILDKESAANTLSVILAAWPNELLQ